MRKGFKIFVRGGRYKLKFILRHNKIGHSSQIEKRVHLKGCKIGDYVYIGSDCVINHTTIGNYSCIASTVKIGGMEHSYWFPSISPLLSDECVFGKITTIGNDVWIGANAIIRQGITIGNGAIIGAGSIVTHDVPPYTIVYGSPARVQKQRFENKKLEEKVSKSKYWELPPNKAKIVITQLLELKEIQWNSLKVFKIIWAI